jgi:putative endonuclease
MSLDLRSVYGSVCSTRDTGRQGEKLVADYLAGAGYRILATNYYVGHREIDIIARKDQTIVFVEVKTRKSGLYGSGLHSVTSKKMHNIAAAARTYLYRTGCSRCSVRFDVAGVDEGGITYIENAFYP